MLAPRPTLLLLALLTVSFFAAVTESFGLSRHSDNYVSLSSFFEKRDQGHNTPPCPPSKNKPKIIEVKDDGAKVGILPYTEEMIRKGNEEAAKAGKHKPDTTEPSKKSGDKRSEDHLSKRANGQLRGYYQAAPVKVATDSSDGIFFDWRMDIGSQIVGTKDLCGCTVLVIASPFATFLMHIWERRANENQAWLMEPTGRAQRQKDAEFVNKGVEFIRSILRLTGGNLGNAFNGWFPADNTFIHIVAPGANPDYDHNGGNPWYATATRNNPLRLIYKAQSDALIRAAVDLLIPGRMQNQARVHRYRRRYHTDRNHGRDDREFIILKPTTVSNGAVWLYMLYDDVEGYPVARLA